MPAQLPILVNKLFFDHSHLRKEIDMLKLVVLIFIIAILITAGHANRWTYEEAEQPISEDSSTE